MTTHNTDNDDWSKLGMQWRQQAIELDFSEQDLHTRLRRQRTLLTLMTVAEALSLLITLGAVVWMTHHWLTGRIGPILIGWLLLQGALVFWMRRRQPTSYDAGVLDRLDASIEHDSRIVESLRLGGLTGSVALAGMIVAVAVCLHNGSILASPASIAAFGLLFLYVFTVQVAIMVYARRVRRRREKLEAIRDSLKAP
jgi:hypothetical protein